MKESEIVKAIEKYLRTIPNCFFFKEHGGIYGTTGIPDIICCVDGKFVAFEVKTKDGKATILQQIAINKINKANGIAKVVRSVEEVKEIIKNLIRV